MENIIKFKTKKFIKFRDNPPEKAILLAMNIAHYDDIPRQFLEYDITFDKNEKFELDKTVRYIILIFFDYEHKNIFATLRKCEGDKEKYYKERIFQDFVVKYI